MEVKEQGWLRRVKMKPLNLKCKFCNGSLKKNGNVVCFKDIAEQMENTGYVTFECKDCNGVNKQNVTILFELIFDLKYLGYSFEIKNTYKN